METITRLIGERIKLAREAAGLSQEKLTQAIGFNDNHKAFADKGYAVFGISADSPTTQVREPLVSFFLSFFLLSVFFFFTLSCVFLFLTPAFFSSSSSSPPALPHH